jgi:Uma2 family endonuclease
MARPARRRATYEDLLEVPDRLVAEIIDGELITSPRPAPAHALASSALGAELGGPFQFGRGGPGGWWILDEPELHLGGDILVPDLAGWRTTRLPAMPSTAFFEIAPDWVCEMISPSSGQTDRVAKLPVYAREEVGYAWIVDPIARTVEVFRRQGQGWLLARTAGGDARVRLEPFEALELDLLHLWGETRAHG